MLFTGEARFAACATNGHASHYRYPPRTMHRRGRTPKLPGRFPHREATWR